MEQDQGGPVRTGPPWSCFVSFAAAGDGLEKAFAVGEVLQRYAGVGVAAVQKEHLALDYLHQFAVGEVEALAAGHAEGAPVRDQDAGVLD